MPEAFFQATGTTYSACVQRLDTLQQLLTALRQPMDKTALLTRLMTRAVQSIAAAASENSPAV